MRKPGDAAPGFTLPDQDGRPTSLEELLSDGPLVLYFYPADFTPLCTAEACSMRDIHADLAAAGLRVAGVSPQGCESHRRFREKHALPFTLLADEGKEVCRAYGVLAGFGLVVRRVTFLVARDGRIADAVESNFSARRHERFVLRAMEHARAGAGRASPCNASPGEAPAGDAGAEGPAQSATT